MEDQSCLRKWHHQKEKGDEKYNSYNGCIREEVPIHDRQVGEASAENFLLHFEDLSGVGSLQARHQRAGCSVLAAKQLAEFYRPTR